MRFAGCVAAVRVVGLALPLLLLGSCREDPEARRAVIYDLKRDPTVENRAEIRASLADENRDVRATALNALVSLREEDALALVLDGLADPDGFVRATAAKLAGDLGRPESVEKLVERLTADGDPVVRQRAAEALTRLGGGRAVEGLARALADPMEQVRLEAARGIRELDPGFDVPALSRLVLEDPVWEIRVQAARALAQSGTPEALPVLQAAAADSNEFVRAAARNALAELGIEAAGAPAEEQKH